MGRRLHIHLKYQKRLADVSKSKHSCTTYAHSSEYLQLAKRIRLLHSLARTSSDPSEVLQTSLQLKCAQVAVENDTIGRIIREPLSVLETGAFFSDFSRTIGLMDRRRLAGCREAGRDENLILEVDSEVLEKKQSALVSAVASVSEKLGIRDIKARWQMANETANTSVDVYFEACHAIRNGADAAMIM